MTERIIWSHATINKDSKLWLMLAPSEMLGSHLCDVTDLSPLMFTSSRHSSRCSVRPHAAWSSDVASRPTYSCSLPLRWGAGLLPSYLAHRGPDSASSSQCVTGGCGGFLWLHTNIFFLFPLAWFIFQPLTGYMLHVNHSVGRFSQTGGQWRCCEIKSLLD